MSNGYPSFGGTNGVALLDLGQGGSVRHAAGDASFTGAMIFGEEETRTAEHRQTQGVTVYRDHLGSSGARVTLSGTMRTKTAAIMRTIIAELNELTTGSLRTPDGLPGPVDPAKFKPTRLTDFDGAVLSERVILERWRSIGSRRVTPEWPALMKAELVFRMLD